MKKLIVLFFALVLGSSQVFASNENPASKDQKLRNEVADLLKSPEIELEKDEISASIQFTLNNKGEIVVLTVDSEEDVVEYFVKSRLNYKKVNSKVINNRIFNVTLRIKRPENS